MDKAGRALQSLALLGLCAHASIADAGTVTVGSRNAIRSQLVTVPISFSGDGTTVRFTAQVSFDPARLEFVSLVPVAGALCTRLAPPNDTLVSVQAPGSPSPLPLPSDPLRYCDMTFRVSATAAGGFAPLLVVSSECFDGVVSGTPCATTGGAVGIASAESTPTVGTRLSVAGYVADIEKLRTVLLTNRSDQELNFNCAVSGDAALTLRSPATFQIASQAASTVTIGCALPPIGPSLNGLLVCTTPNDSVQPSLQYGLSCSTVPDGAPLPGDQIFSDALQGGDQLGSSAALGVLADGTNVMVLGAPFAGSDANGRVYIMEGLPQPVGNAPSGSLAKAGGMHLVAVLAAPPKDARQPQLIGDKFGASVAISRDGRTIAVGAPTTGSTGQSPGRGQVRIFRRPVAGWGGSLPPGAPVPGAVEVTNGDVVLDPPAPSGGVLPNEFGAKLAFAPDGSLVVGAPATTVGAPGVGAVYAYADVGGTGVGFFLPPPGPLLSTSPAGEGRFGDALGATGGMLVIGAPKEGAQNTQGGAAYMFPVAGSTVGVPQRIVPAANQPGDKFGVSVAVSGDVVIVGASDASTSAGAQSGAATVFRPNAAGTLVEQSTLVPAPGAQQGAGAAVATNGDTIVLGAPKASVDGTNQRGRVYVYDVKLAFSAVEQPQFILENTGGEANDAFGQAVSANQRQVVAGVPLDDRPIDASTTLIDKGRADPFLLDRILRSGFE